MATSSRRVRGVRNRPLSARPVPRVEVSDWFRPQSARGANESADTARKSKVGRHLERTTVQRPVAVSDWLREQEELDSSGAEPPPESPRARALLASIRGPISPNQTSDSYVQRLERMLLSLRGQLDGRAQGEEVRNDGGGSEKENERVQLARSDGVFRTDKAAPLNGHIVHSRNSEGEQTVGIAPANQTAASGPNQVETGGLKRGPAKTGAQTPSKPMAKATDTAARSHSSLRHSVSRGIENEEEGAHSVALPLVDGPGETRRQKRGVVRGGGRRKESRVSEWPQLAVEEEEYRRALGIAAGWDVRPLHPSRLGEVEAEADGQSESEDEFEDSGSDRRTRNRSGAKGMVGEAEIRGRKPALVETEATTVRAALRMASQADVGRDSDSGSGESSGSEAETRSSRDVRDTWKHGIGRRNGVWEHVLERGVRNGRFEDSQSDMGSRDKDFYGDLKERDFETEERSQKMRASGNAQRSDRTDGTDSPESDISGSEGNPSRWAESRHLGDLLYDSVAFEDDPGGDPLYYSDGELGGRYCPDSDARDAAFQRPRSAETSARARYWGEGRPTEYNAPNDRVFFQREGGGVQGRVTLSGREPGSRHPTTDHRHSCHNNCVRYMGVPRGATVPRPFTFDERERLREQSIADTRRAQDRALKDEVDWYLTKHPFKANPLPRSTVLPRFAKLTAARDKRRQDVHAQSTELLRSMEKPFSFYNANTISRARGLSQTADQKAAEHRGPSFKANPVPAAVKEKKFDTLVKEMELKRDLRKRRALEELKNSKLPPRMEMHEKAKRAAAAPSAVKAEISFQKRRAAVRDVPDFEKLHQRFKASLERARAEQPVTHPEAFSFYEKPSLSARKKEKIIRDIDEDEERLPEQRWPFKAPRTKIRATPPPAFPPPLVVPAKTLAVKLKELKVKEEMAQGLYDNREEKEKRKAKQRKKEDERRKALWEAFQIQSRARMSKSATYRASRKKATWRGWDSPSTGHDSSADMHRAARMKQEEERAREIVEQALMDNGLPFSLDEILDA